MAKNTSLNYSTLIYQVREQLDITWAEYVLLDMVYHLSAGTGTGWTTMNKYGMADTMGMTFKGFDKMKDRLVERGLLVISDNKRGMQPGEAYLHVANRYVGKGELSSRSRVRKSELSSMKSELSSEKGELSTDNNNDNNVIAATAGTKFQAPATNKVSQTDSVGSTPNTEHWRELTEILDPGLTYTAWYGKELTEALTHLTFDQLIVSARHYALQFTEGGDQWLRQNQTKMKTLRMFLAAPQTGRYANEPRYITYYEMARRSGVQTPEQAAEKAKLRAEHEAKMEAEVEQNAAKDRQNIAGNMAKMKEMNRLKAEGMSHEDARKQVFGK